VNGVESNARLADRDARLADVCERSFVLWTWMLRRTAVAFGDHDCAVIMW
jgi:hypothetical protein